MLFAVLQPASCAQVAGCSWRYPHARHWPRSNSFTACALQQGFLAPGTDITPIVPALEKIWADSLGQSMAAFNFRTVTSKFNELVYQYPIRIPERYSLVIRCSNAGSSATQSAPVWCVRAGCVDGSSQSTPHLLPQMLFPGYQGATRHCAVSWTVDCCDHLCVSCIMNAAASAQLVRHVGCCCDCYIHLESRLRPFCAGRC